MWNKSASPLLLTLVNEEFCEILWYYSDINPMENTPDFPLVEILLRMELQSVEREPFMFQREN